MAAQAQEPILAAARSAPSLWAWDALRATVTAVTQDLRELHQLMLFTPAFASIGAPGQAAGLIAIAQADSDDAQHIVIAMYHADAAAAHAARDALITLRHEAMLSTGRPLQDLLDGLGGVWEETQVLDAPDGAAVLRMPVRFAPQREALSEDNPQEAGRPFALFYRMLMQRDLQWLAQPGT